MSEEEKEAIKVLKDLLEEFEDVEKYAIVNLSKKEFESFQVILNLIEKQQKEINELKCAITSQSKHISQDQKEIEEYKETINALKPNLKELIKMSNFAMQKDYVSKDKIRAKIKELEETIKKKRQLNIKEWVGFEENEIEILEELLKENNND